MNKNLKFLDRFDRNLNIYQLICELSERAHNLFATDISSGKTGKEDTFAEMVMDEKLDSGQKVPSKIEPEANDSNASEGN